MIRHLDAFATTVVKNASFAVAIQTDEADAGSMSAPDQAPHPGQFSGLSRLKLFWALSRTPHGLLDMCTPAFSALLWLGHFPALPIVGLGLLTTFAGYTAVYALNDLVDYRTDRQKAAAGNLAGGEGDLDGLVVRHPMAQGLLTFREGLLWALSWSLAAVVGAYLLNPVCVAIFFAGCLLEAVYCKLWRVSPFRTIVSGGVKTTGAVAAVYAVDPAPALDYVLLVFCMLFCWEIGGQNIPNDWADLEEDRRFNARTIPVCYGLQTSGRLVLGTLILTLFLNLLVFRAPVKPVGWGIAGLALAAGWFLLLLPALKLKRSKLRREALELFNRASYYPPVLLVLVLLNFII
jgi:4-hydroxybenzoate polyprenyltransferase